MATNIQILNTADDVTPEILDAAEQVIDYFDGDKIDSWDRFWDLLCGYGDWDIEQTDTPACRKIQRHVRDFMREV